MARRKKMTLDEYVENREDMTFIVVAGSDETGWQICVRLDGTYYEKEVALEQAKFVSKTLGIPLADGES